MLIRPSMGMLAPRASAGGSNVYTANLIAATVSKITPAGVATTTWATVGASPQGIAIF